MKKLVSVLVSDLTLSTIGMVKLLSMLNVKSMWVVFTTAVLIFQVFLLIGIIIKDLIERS